MNIYVLLHFESRQNHCQTFEYTNPLMTSHCKNCLEARKQKIMATSESLIFPGTMLPFAQDFFTT